MDGTQYTVTLSEFKLFHRIDRAVYRTLALDLFRNSVESLYVLALWLWLERSGFYNFVSRVLSLPPSLVDQLADEAITCLTYLNPYLPFQLSETMTEIPLTHCVADKDISLQFFLGRGPAAFGEVVSIVQGVCMPSASDLMEAARGLRGPAPLSGGGSSNNNNNGRMVFVTFSKGYPMTEGKVKGLLGGLLGGGDRVKSVHMQEVGRGKQALYATVELAEPALVRRLLMNGATKVKFVIGGKEFWVRRYGMGGGSPPTCAAAAPCDLSGVGPGVAGTGPH